MVLDFSSTGWRWQLGSSSWRAQFLHVICVFIKVKVADEYGGNLRVRLAVSRCGKGGCKEFDASRCP